MGIQSNRSAAKALLDIGAVDFTVESPVRFRSGICSPIYIDNRTLISHPEPWHDIIDCFQLVISDSDLDYDILAGVADGGVPHCSALAYTLQRPSVFIRKEAKKHGLRKIIEGGDVDGKRVLLVEDHVTTGGSSVSAIQELRDANAEVTDVVSIISYRFKAATELFDNHDLRLHTLTDFDTILDMAMERELINKTELDIIVNWLEKHRT